MLKVLHTADIHLGAKFSGLGHKGASQREQLLATFKNVTDTAITEKVDIVLIAGDLFDSNQQPQKNIDLAIEQFNLLGSSNIPVCLVPGTHDSFDSSSIYRKIDFAAKCPNLKIFTDENTSWKEYPGLDLTVYGKPNLSNRSSVSPLKGLGRATSTKFHVGMAHGSLHIPEKVAEDDHVFRLEEVKEAGMDYLALGHWHRVYECPAELPAWYPGPPEWIPGQEEQGAVLLVSLSPAGEVKVEARKLGLRDYSEVDLDMSEMEDLATLKSMISAVADQNLIARVTLNGLRDVELLLNTEDLESDLGEKFFHLRVIDKSHPKSREISAGEERLIASRFIRLMKSQIDGLEGEDKEIAESALQYGVALLDGKDVL